MIDECEPIDPVLAEYRLVRGELNAPAAAAEIATLRETVASLQAVVVLHQQIRSALEARVKVQDEIISALRGS